MYCVKIIHGIIFVLVVLFFDTVAAEQKPRVYYYVKDHLGSTRLVIDREKAAEQLEALSNGTSTDYNVKGIVETASYYPFGKQMPGKCATSGVNKRTTEKFTGKELDSDGQIDWVNPGQIDPGEQGLDLSYFGARYYDAEIIGWLSIDPVEGNDWSPYLYNHNKPLLLVDPDGRNPWFFISKIVIGKMTLQNKTADLLNPADLLNTVNEYANDPQKMGATMGGLQVTGGAGMLTLGALGCTNPLIGAGLVLVGGLNIAFGSGEIANSLVNKKSAFNGQGPMEFIGEGVAGKPGKVTGALLDFSASGAYAANKGPGLLKMMLPAFGAGVKAKHAVDVMTAPSTGD